MTNNLTRTVTAAFFAVLFGATMVLGAVGPAVDTRPALAPANHT